MTDLDSDDPALDGRDRPEPDKRKSGHGVWAWPSPETIAAWEEEARNGW